ncbi:FANCF protein, partial [Formicarius rufipectus]|nr:FANCF protein [Formicarius rufipectus]
RTGGAKGAMAAVLGQAERLPELLSVSRSALVRHWDPLTLDRALQWARYFQHLHDRFRARPQLREALGQRLRRAQSCPLLVFPALGRCPQLLGLALLENRALPPAACRRLLLRLLQPPGAGAGPELCGLALLARRAVVATALALLGQGSGAEGDGEREGSGLNGNRESAAGDGCVAGLLLSWLLGNLEQFSAFCLCLPGSLLASLASHYFQLSRSYLDLLTSWGSHLHYDPLQGRWVKSCLDKAELSWEELRERFGCLCQGSALLREQTQATLELLKTRDGDFTVRGLSVWTDLLTEMKEYLRNEV